MITYYLQIDNTVVAYDKQADEPSHHLAFTSGQRAFQTKQDLLDLSAGWPGSRLVEIWNSIPGVKPVTKFMNRTRGVERIWEALGAGGATEQPNEDETPKEAPAHEEPVEPQFRAQGPGEWESGPAISEAKVIEPAEPNEQPASKDVSFAELVAQLGLRDGAKNTKIVELLSQPNGAKIRELMDATGWQIHTCQGFIAGTLGTKHGLTVSSEGGETKLDRRYRILGAGEMKPAKEPKAPKDGQARTKEPSKAELRAFIDQIADTASFALEGNEWPARTLKEFVQQARTMTGLTDAGQ